jgi:hypothetical protein
MLICNETANAKTVLTLVIVWVVVISSPGLGVSLSVLITIFSEGSNVENTTRLELTPTFPTESDAVTETRFSPIDSGIAALHDANPLQLPLRLPFSQRTEDTTKSSWAVPASTRLVEDTDSDVIDTTGGLVSTFRYWLSMENAETEHNRRATIQ